MRKCKYDEQVDKYLLDKLTPSEKEQFEEHYFNCPSCFEQMIARDDLIQVVKTRGYEIFRPETGTEKAGTISWPERVFSFLTPGQWAAAAVTTALLLVVILTVIPSFRAPSPQFFLNGEDTVVRGNSINLISPIIDIVTIPSYFEWRKIGEDVEYRIYIYNHELLWTSSTKDTRVTLPEEIKKKMINGEKYTWQVKAFSPEGTLLAVSSKVQFKIAR